MPFDTNQRSYQDLREGWKTRTTSIVAWVGAGLSAPAGIPLWSGLKTALENEATEVTKALPHDKEGKRRRALLQVARNEANTWRSFIHLHEVLGQTTYEASIRRALTPNRAKGVPENYRRLWRLRPAGIIDLNLDGLSAQAHASVSSGTERVVLFEGGQVASRIHVLKSTDPWIARLHGTIDARDTWILTEEELNALFATPGYQEFVRASFVGRCNVFIGMSADDIAAGGHLYNLTQMGLRTGDHFWITHRNDSQTRQWAEAAGLRVVLYEGKGKDHSQIDEFFEDLLKYVPRDEEPPPVRPDAALLSTLPLSTFPTPSTLQGMDPEQIRSSLNGRAIEILNSTLTEGNKRTEYNKFIKDYNRALALAWNVEEFEPDNRLFGYEIERQIGEGAFGRVFEAKAPDGKRVALKLLHERIRRDPTMLTAFRRGVSSMRILAAHGVKGMVPYYAATELPAMVAMELVDGPNLASAVEAQQITDWSTILRISLDLSDIILRGHQLPERVLHRDIRPSNVMLDHFYHGGEWEVVVLDFDLSWHRDAQDESIALPSAKFGYLAPEQLTRRPGVSTRNASVDSYGLGMTLRFLATGIQPTPGEHLRSDWQVRLVSELRTRYATKLKCLGARFAHVIYMCTLDEQPVRWDLSQARREILVLRDAEQDIATVTAAAIIAEEIASRSVRLSDKYNRGENSQDIVAAFARGPRVVLRPSTADATVKIELDWASSGYDSRKMINKWIRTAGEQAASLLRGTPLSSVTSSHDPGTAWVGSVLRLPVTELQVEAVTAGIDRAIEVMTLT